MQTTRAKVYADSTTLRSCDWRDALRADDEYVARAHLRAADPIVRRYRRLLRGAA